MPETPELVPVPEVVVPAEPVVPVVAPPEVPPAPPPVVEPVIVKKVEVEPTTRYDSDRRVFIHTDKDGNVTEQKG